ncbi:hypothetical protein SEVIR_1G293951v4 [Setaria viridis]
MGPGGEIGVGGAARGGGEGKRGEARQAWRRQASRARQQARRGKGETSVGKVRCAIFAAGFITWSDLFIYPLPFYYCAEEEEATRGVENTKEKGKEQRKLPHPIPCVPSTARSLGPRCQRRVGAAAPLPCSWRERKGEAGGGRRRARGRVGDCLDGGPGGVGSLVRWGTRHGREGFVFGWRGFWTGWDDQDGSVGDGRPVERAAVSKGLLGCSVRLPRGTAWGAGRGARGSVQLTT